MVRRTQERLLRIAPTYTQDAWIRSPAIIPILIGPMGEGKTWAATAAIINKAQHWWTKTQKPMRFAVIRDTFENIKRMTVPSIHESFGDIVQFSDGLKKMKFVDGTAEGDLFGMDDLASLSKLQGAEYALVWLEEPAPMHDRANAGLSIDVLNTSIARAARQINAERQKLGLMPRVQVTMNPADEEHWTYKEFIKIPRFGPLPGYNPEFPDVTMEVIQIPYGENYHLSDIARQMTKAAFVDNPGMWQRYVEGKFAHVLAGEPVTPEYNEKIHRLDHEPPVLPGVMGFRMWDGGLNPTCLMGQIHPSGRIVHIDSFVGENIGVKQLIELKVRPTTEFKYERVPMWRDIGDSSMMYKEPGNSVWSPALRIMRLLGTDLGKEVAFEPGPVKWDPRRDALKEALTKLIDGEPFVQLSKTEEKLHGAFRGGFHYRKDPTGRVMKHSPVKDIHSHPGDAAGYGYAVLLGFADKPEDIGKPPNRGGIKYPEMGVV